jgi:hypothetical protein
MQLTQRQIDLEDEQTIKSMTDYLGAIGYWVHKMCPDQGEDINTAQPISGNVICAEATWPELIEDYVWGDDAVIDSDDLDFCVHSDTLPDIRCNISGCRPEDCVTSQEYSDSEQQEPDNSIFTENHTSLAQLAPTMIICLDDGNAISQPVTGGLVCNSMETTWPELTGGYLWSQAFDSSNVNGNMIWNFCAYHATLDDIECDNTGCHQEDCEESLIDTDNDGITDKNEINIYQTDPNNPDTDGDSYNDGEEVNNGYNPLGEGLLE